jgi:hypothetical protein
MNKRTLVVLVMAVLLLASLACGSSTPGEPLPEGVLFQDDFSDTSSGWDRITADEGITDYENGVYRILVNLDSTDVWANPGLDFTDTVVEVEATKVGGSDENDFGIICRYQDVSNFYFQIITSDGYYAIGKVLDGEQIFISADGFVEGTAINQGNVTNIIRADCVGSTLTLYANGTELDSVEDNSFASGDVGLLAGTFEVVGTDIHFDNFVVRAP